MTHQTRAMTEKAPWNSSHAAKNPQTRVLIVDDERLLRWAIVETLTAHGYDVSEAGDAQSALRALRELRTSPDLVLLDLFLPDSCDLRVLTIIRALATVPVILMTAFATPDIVEQSAAMGARVIPKPFDMDTLTSLIERTVTAQPQ
jgi:two-component system KDP operon response regulator KdpE